MCFKNFHLALYGSFPVVYIDHKEIQKYLCIYVYPKNQVKCTEYAELYALDTFVLEMPRTKEVLIYFGNVSFIFNTNSDHLPRIAIAITIPHSSK